MQPIAVWEVRCRPLGPGTRVLRWAVRAWEAEDALERYVEAGFEEADVISVTRAPLPLELDS